MTVFGLGSDMGLKQIKSCQVALWYLRKLFVPFGLPKMIVVDTDELFMKFPTRFPRDLTYTGT